MKGILYLSKEIKPFTGEILTSLLELASTENSNHNISGYLFYSDGYFVQYIEGDETEMDTLFANISNDTTHEVLISTEILDLTVRKFPNWTMEKLTNSQYIQIKQEHILKDILAFNHQLDSANDGSDWSKSSWRIIDKIAS